MTISDSPYLSAASHDAFTTEVSAALVPANATDGAFWVGRSSESDGWVGGWGPVTNRVLARRDALIPLPAADAHGALGVLVLGIIQAALRPLLPVARVGVLGDTVVAALVRAYLEQRVVTVVSDATPQSLDLLVDTTGDVAVWGPALATVVTEGTALLLGAAARRTSDYNFYPDMHRRSLKVVSRNWRTPVDPAALRELAPLAASAAASIRDPRWVQQSNENGRQAASSTWQLVEWS